MAERIEPERQPSEDVADRGDQRESVAEAADDRCQGRERKVCQEHLEPATPKRKPHADLREQRRAPRASGDERDVARYSGAVAPENRDDARALHDQRVGADAFFDPRAETSSRRRPRAYGGDGLGLVIERTVDATTAIGRETGRQTVGGRGVD